MHIARHLRFGWPTRPEGRVGQPRVRFRDAVPVPRDRRELRRRLRQVARSVKRERRAETTAILQRLSADHVLLSRLMPVPHDTGDIVEFTDGTCLLVILFTAKVDMERLGQRAAAHDPVWLAHMQPCFGHRRFWLWFASAGQPVPLEVLASVQALAMACPEERGER